MTTPSRVPVIMLTGFLGSGKTTLLNRLMRARPGSSEETHGPGQETGQKRGPASGRMAIVVNEFGEVGIDGDLLPASMTRQVELPGGCICCLLSEDLDKTLLDLLDSTPDLDLIVIETTGVAEPLPIEWSLEREPLSERVRLAATITVVDATHFEHSRALSPAVDAQVRYADILVLSKSDLLDQPALPASLVAALDELNATAPRVSGSIQEITEILWSAIQDPALPAQPLRASRPDAPEAGSDHEPAGHGFHTIWLPIENVLDLEELTDGLEALPGTYVRIKGIAKAIDESTGSTEPRWIAFHRVGTRVSSEPLDELPSNPPRARVVAVGPHVEARPLAACLAAAVVPCES
jgi:G3E family GTPase